MQATAAAVMAGANGRKHAGFGQGEGEHLLHDSQDKFGAGGDVDFLEEAVQMRVRGVLGNSQTLSDPCLWEIVKDALDDLQLALRDAEGVCNLKPGMFGEQ